MEREKQHRPRDHNARKITPDGMEERSENIGDTSRGDFSFRTEQRDPSDSHTPSQSALQSRLMKSEDDRRNTPADRHQTGAEDHSVRQRERASRSEPASVHETIARHKKQARQFTEHAARPGEENKTAENDGGNVSPAQAVDSIPVETQPHIEQAPVQDISSAPDTTPFQKKPAQDFTHHSQTPEQSGDVSSGMRRDKTQKLSFTHDNKPLAADAVDDSVPLERSGGDAQAAQPMSNPPRDIADSNPRTSKKSKKQRKRAKKQRQRFEELRPDKPNAPQTTGTPPVETATDSGQKPDIQTVSEQPQTEKAEGSPANVSAPVRDVPLSHEHTPRFTERQGKLRFDKAAAVAEKIRRGSKIPPAAAKYTAPETGKADNSDDPVGSDEVKEKPQTPSVEAESDAAGEENTQPAAERDSGEEPADSVKSDSDSGEKKPDKKPGKLQFAEDEKTPAPDGEKSDKTPADKKLDKARRKAERSGEKLDAAQKKLPKKRRITFDKKIDEKDAGASGTAKPKRKLRFETEVKSQRQHLKGPLVTRPVKLGASSLIRHAHKKIYQVEHENVGTQAAHKAERMVEGGLRRAYRLHKTAPYRKVSKLKRKTTKLNIKADYRQALLDNPKLKSNLFSRMAQKHKIKRKYAKAAREARKAAKRAQRAGSMMGKATGAVARLVAWHPVVFGIIAALFLLVIIISSIFTSFTNIASNVGTAVIATSYLAEDADVDNAELSYTEWETDLQFELARVESDRPGYDEYRYDVGDISHNPYELMAFLTAVYHDFSDADVEAVLREIFAEQYQLTYTPSVETRYREGVDGQQEAYDWHVLTVTLTSRSFSDCIFSRMTAEERQIYTLLMQSKGNRMYSASPFDFNWLPYVSSYYGYRVHPTSGAKDYHMGIDIAVPTGTDIQAGHDGTVTTTSYDSGGYGYYVVIEDGKGLVTKYAHCDTLLVNAGQTVNKGDVIAKSGNTGNSTGPHLHFEVIRNGQYLNPLYFAETNDTGGAPVFDGDAGSPLGDGSYAALIAEAERHLGKAYVFGANGPANFDCSSYVCWIFTHSGVKNMPRTTAYGIYTQYCTPISPSEAQPGDIIFFHSTYSTTSPISHVGLYVGEGKMIHAGNPIGYTSINSSYWQQHFYAFGRVTP